MAKEDENLLWVRSQLEELVFVRNANGGLSPSDEALYRHLCRQEAALIGQATAAA